MDEIDFLTGLRQRAFAKNYVSKLISSKSSFSLIFLDLDNFKIINDLYGHTKGDAVIEKFSGIISSLLRSTDILTRYGGDEFLIILPNSSKLESRKIALRLLEKIKSNKIDEFIITFSFGIAEFPEDGESFEELVKKADIKLYEMKSKKGKGVSKRYDLIEPVKAFGREKERILILDKAKASLEGSGQFVLISGPFGIGKTFFAYKMIDEISNFYKYVFYIQLSRRDSRDDFSLFKRLVRKEFETLFERKLRDFEAFNKFSNYEAVLFNSICDSLVLKSKEGPILYYIENFEFADSLSLSMMTEFLEKMQKTPVMIIGTFKGNPDDRFNELNKMKNFLEVKLGPLSSKSIKQVVFNMLGTQNIEKKTFEELVKNSKGNPLILTELLKSAINEGLILKKGSETFIKDVYTIKLRFGTDNYRASMLEKLSLEEKVILEYISVASGEINCQVISKIIQKHGTKFLEAYENLINNGIVSEEGSVAKIRYPFITDHIIRKLSNVKRNALLYTIAKVEESTQDSELIESSIEHYISSGDRLKAKKILITLAKNDEKSFNLFNSMQKYKHASDLAFDKEEKTKLLKKVLEISSRINKGQEIIRIFKEHFLERTTDPDIILKVAEAYDNLGEYTKSLEMLDKIKNGRLEIKVSAIVLRSWICYTLGKIDEAQKELNKIDFKKLPPSLYAYSSNIKGILEMEKGNYEESIKIFDDSLELAKIYRKETALAIENNLANAKIALGYFEEALSLLDDVIKESERMYNSLYTAIAVYNKGDVYFQIGNFKEATYYYNKAHIISKKINNALGIGYYNLSIGLSKIAKSKFEDAKKDLYKAYRIFENLGAQKELTLTKANLINLYTVLGEKEKVETLIRDFPFDNQNEASITGIINASNYFLRYKIFDKITELYEILKAATKYRFSVTTEIKIYDALSEIAEKLNLKMESRIYKEKKNLIIGDLISKFSSEENKKLYLAKPRFT